MGLWCLWWCADCEKSCVERADSDDIRGDFAIDGDGLDNFGDESVDSDDNVGDRREKGGSTGW